MDDWLMPGIPRTIADDPSMETVRRIRASVAKDTGQVVESDLLLDCPFCGARPYVQVHELDETCVEARVVCPSCHEARAAGADLRVHRRLRPQRRYPHASGSCLHSSGAPARRVREYRRLPVQPLRI